VQTDPNTIFLGQGDTPTENSSAEVSVTFTPNTPGPGRVLLGSFDESMNVDGRWVPGRRLNGDETRNNMRWQDMRSFGIYRYTVFQRD